MPYKLWVKGPSHVATAEATRRGVKVLGVEGFPVSEETILCCPDDTRTTERITAWFTEPTDGAPFVGWPWGTLLFFM